MGVGGRGMRVEFFTFQSEFPSSFPWLPRAIKLFHFYRHLIALSLNSSAFRGAMQIGRSEWTAPPTLVTYLISWSRGLIQMFELTCVSERRLELCGVLCGVLFSDVM